MVLELPPPSVEDTGEASSGLFMLGSHHVLECLSALLDEDSVELLWIFLTGTPQLRRDGEGDHEIWHREEPRFLLGSPDLLVVGSALRTATVVAAVVGLSLIHI